MSKGLEALKKLRQNNIDNSHLFDDELLDVIEKELKALEIIKEKIMPFVSIEYEDYCKEYRIYDAELYLHDTITKEEYDLLKEVLKKEN